MFEVEAAKETEKTKAETIVLYPETEVSGVFDQLLFGQENTILL